MVSIILPTFNRAKFLPETIQSVLTQSYGDFELIIMDDGSEDETKDLVLAYQDPRIKYFQLPHTGFTSRLKNFAIRQSAGDFLAFIDSDDMWKEGKLQRQMDLLAENPSIGFSITDVTTFRGDTVLLDHSYHLQNTVQCISIFQWMKQSRFLIYNPTLVIRKGCLHRIGYFDETMRSGDYHFNMRLACHFDAGIIYESLLWRRVHDSNMSEQIPMENYGEYLSSFSQLFAEGMIEKKYLQKARSNAFFKMGKLEAARGNTAEARRLYIASLRVNPLQRQCYAQWLNTFLEKR